MPAPQRDRLPESAHPGTVFAAWPMPQWIGWRSAFEIEEAAALLIVEAGDHTLGNFPGAYEVTQIAARLVGVQAGQHREGIVVEHPAGRSLAPPSA